jgi:hypothetical protein
MELEIIGPTEHSETDLTTDQNQRFEHIMKFEDELNMIQSSKSSTETPKVNEVPRGQDLYIDSNINSEPKLASERPKRRFKYEVTKEIKAIELSLGLKHKRVTGVSVDDLEKYLTELNAMPRPLETELTSIPIPPDVYNRKDTLPSSQQGDVIDPIIAKKHLTQQSTLRTPQPGQNPNSLSSTRTDDNMVDFLFRANLMLFNGMELLSQKTEGQTGINFQGISERLIHDKQNGTALNDIYKKIYQENSEVIKTYGSPLMELSFYTLATCSVAATQNLKKKSIEGRQ